jgi:hypothetical protein
MAQKLGYTVCKYVGMLKENSLATNADLTAMSLPKRSDDSDVTITDDKIMANGDNHDTGGHGSNRAGGTIAITVNSGYVGGAGVGNGEQAGNATVTITGGRVKMSGANGSQPPTASAATFI